MLTLGCCILCLSVRNAVVNVARNAMFNIVVRRAVLRATNKEL